VCEADALGGGPSIGSGQACRKKPAEKSNRRISKHEVGHARTISLKESANHVRRTSHKALSTIVDFKYQQLQKSAN
jgi:hypothetical protein